MDFGSNSDGDDAFGAGEGCAFETASIQHRVNELFGFEPKDKQVEAIQHLLCDRSDRILISKTGIIIFQAPPPIHLPQSLRLPEITIHRRARA
jgi:hypothetical protein